MLFRIDPTSAVGLADQIAAQVRGELAAGRLGPGEKLPAAREVAAGLDVNMHTVLRAYSQLRDEVNRPGMSGDSVPWEGWSHVREYVEEVPGRAA